MPQRRSCPDLTPPGCAFPTAITDRASRGGDGDDHAAPVKFVPTSGTNSTSGERSRSDSRTARQADNADGAARYYTSVLRNGRIGTTARYMPEMAKASGSREGDVVTVEFEAEGQQLLALNGGSHHAITPGISFMVERDTQEGIDELWEAFGNGGATMACGWVTDRFGVSWQVMPAQMIAWMRSEDVEARPRMWSARLDMTKLDLAILRAAYEGQPVTT